MFKSLAYIREYEDESEA